MAGRTKRPVSFDTTVRTMPVVSSVSVTITPGRTLPDWSEAIPLSSATAPCPNTEPADIKTITAMHATSRSMFCPPLAEGHHMVSRICRFLVFWLRKHRTHHSVSQDNYCEL